MGFHLGFCVVNASSCSRLGWNVWKQLCFLAEVVTKRASSVCVYVSKWKHWGLPWFNTSSDCLSNMISLKLIGLCLSKRLLTLQGHHCFLRHHIRSFHYYYYLANAVFRGSISSWRQNMMEAGALKIRKTTLLWNQFVWAKGVDLQNDTEL